MAKKIPKFSYTGQCSTGSDDTYWYIFLTTSGTLTFEYAKAGVDVGCVGGGGSSACIRQAGNPAGGSGGGGPGGGYEEGTMGGEAAAGGSGIVILRGTQDDLLPVFFNGVQLSEIWLNGVKATGLIRDGVRVFMRAIRRFDAERRDDRNRRKGGGMHAELPA